MPRLLLTLAILVIVAGIAFAAYRLGHRAGRRKQRALGEVVDPQVVNDLVGVLRNILYPPDPINTVVLIPDQMRVEAVTVLNRASQTQRFLYPTE